MNPKDAPEPPSRPQGPLLISDVTDESMCLEWDPPPSDGGREILKYVVEIIMQPTKDCASKDIIKYKNTPLPGNGGGSCSRRFAKRPYG
jgi:hypothetical protein